VSRIIPDLAALPDESYLTRKQVAALTGFSVPAFKLWATQGRGPRVSRIEQQPRYRIADVRAWLDACDEAASRRTESAR
jgi:predicted DNA-binding transcriptional regulator AlpA